MLNLFVFYLFCIQRMGSIRDKDNINNNIYDNTYQYPSQYMVPYAQAWYPQQYVFHEEKDSVYVILPQRLLDTGPHTYYDNMRYNLPGWIYVECTKETFPIINDAMSDMSYTERAIFSQFILANFPSAAVHPSANFVVQEMMRRGVAAAELRDVYVALVTVNAVRLSTDKYGSRVVQTCLGVMTTDEQLVVSQQLTPDLYQLCQDKYASHVVEMCIDHGLDPVITPLMEMVMNDIVAFTTGQHTCLVLRKLLAHLDNGSSGDIMMEIAHNAAVISTDKYGNYAVQFVLEHGDDDARDVVIQSIQSQFVLLSIQKFSSNVVETAYEKATREQRTNMLMPLVTNPKLLSRVLESKFGVYVVNFMLDPTKPREMHQEFKLFSYHDQQHDTSRT